jgi:broad specificity phosphatase PhoE
MKEVIVLRHGEKDGDELTAEGVKACRELSKQIGNLHIVIASGRNRAVQTASLVSGKQVHTDVRASVPPFPDDEMEMLEDIQATHPLGIIAAIWQKPMLVENARQAGLKLLDLVKETMNALGENERALIVSHDGTMIALEKLLKKESFGTVDHSFGPLEGIRVSENLDTQPFNVHT